MHAAFMPTARRVERPRFVWLGVILETFTAVLAIPVGLIFLNDPTGKSMQLPESWITNTPFGNYVIPGLYLLLFNGVGMLVLAGLSIARHWIAPWLTGALGVGLIIWTAVQLVVMPETMILQPISWQSGSSWASSRCSGCVGRANSASGDAPRRRNGCITAALCATLPACDASLTSSRSRSSSGPAGRHGPEGSDGAYRRRPTWPPGPEARAADTTR